MSREAYIGIDNKARRISKGYIGINGIARQIVLAYIGIGGVARPCWGGDAVKRYGNITPLPINRWNLAGAATDKFALFAGGQLGTQGNASNVVDAYNQSLTLSTPTSLSAPRVILTGVDFNNCAVFISNQIFDIYQGDSLTKTTGTSLPSSAPDAGATIGDFLLLAFSQRTPLSIYNTSFTYVSTTPTTLTAPRHGMGSASGKHYAVFGGGHNSSSGYSSSIVDAYDASLTRTNPQGLSGAGMYATGLSVGDYIIFAGGELSMGKNVDAYDASLTKLKLDNLENTIMQSAGVSTKYIALMAGGFANSIEASAAVHAYNPQLTKLNPSDLSQKKTGCAGSHVGDYILIAGGSDTNSVEAYKIS